MRRGRASLQSARVRSGLVFLLLLAACGATSASDAGVDAAVEVDTSISDAAIADAGVVPPIVIERSLFWNDAGLLDAPGVISFSRAMAAASSDGHGGALLSQWFHRFNTTPHSERALPAQFVDGVMLTQGSDPTQWDLGALPFKVTGIHNRIDLARLEPGGHCGELRVSVSCTDVTLQPFHALFLFRQPLEASDVELGGRVTCAGTARRWAELSGLSETDFPRALQQMFERGFVHSRFLMIETVEFTLAPWEWRQWLPAPDGGVENPPLLEQVDVERLNAPGAARTDFLAWVDSNAAQLDARMIEIPERFRPQSIRVNQGVLRPPLDLPANPSFPNLRRNVELVGCAACHTADAEFVQTRTDRSVSRFYEKELRARAEHLTKLARGEAPRAPFGPLQRSPVLPP